MPETEETQRFDALLEAMLTKPGPDDEPEADEEADGNEA